MLMSVRSFGKLIMVKLFVVNVIRKLIITGLINKYINMTKSAKIKEIPKNTLQEIEAIDWLKNQFGIEKTLEIIEFIKNNK
jgi:archaellum component FlaD/FlaE